ncbi:nuclear transport factor 2 family protein [Cytobacillus spongiae]|jgi:ketosteroid isomerase-like protein|uniref:YybH family protein n=1 Tax=Cytobacillus spongiae TaxID=2901381 RepID=UPI001F2B0833|nr:nuclear transport factor 2 family protein [Cytobacillus spongiae]UII56593.1 nuclear transport factor 2 family protein [Cytobacillus spongiae]
MDILDRYMKATNTHNFDEVKKLLHPNAIFFFSNKTCKNHDEIKVYFERAWEFVKEENYEAHDVEWLFISSTSLTCTYTYFYEGYVNGEYTSGRGRATNVFVKEFDEWLLVHEHLSPLPNG